MTSKVIRIQRNRPSGSDVFERAIGRFASAYADQNERDYHALVEAAKSGRITAEHGL